MMRADWHRIAIAKYRYQFSGANIILRQQIAPEKTCYRLVIVTLIFIVYAISAFEMIDRRRPCRRRFLTREVKTYIAGRCVAASGVHRWSCAR